MKVFNNLDLQLLQILNGVAEHVSALPSASTAYKGRLVYLTTDDTLYFCNGTDWISASGSTTTIAKKSNGVITVTVDGTATDITVYAHPNHSGDVTSTADGATTIGANKVTNAKLAKMGANTIKGNNTNASANAADLTVAQVRTMLNVADGAQANQNAFSNVKNGTTTIAAGSATDTLEITAGSNVTITPDATNKKITIASTNTDTKVTSADNHYSPSGTSAPTLNTATTPTGDTVAVVSQVKGDAKGHVVSQDRVNVPTKEYVDNLISNLGSALKFKGTIGTGGDVTALPNNHTVGDTYLVKTAGTYAGASCEVGDMIVCVKTGTAAANTDWSVVQANWTAVAGESTLAWNTEKTLATIGGVTVKAKLPANPNTDTKVTSAANHYAPAEDTASVLNATSGNVVTGIKRDAKGHVTGINTGSVQRVIAGKEVLIAGTSGNISTGATSIDYISGVQFYNNSGERVMIDYKLVISGSVAMINWESAISITTNTITAHWMVMVS